MTEDSQGKGRSLLKSLRRSPKGLLGATLVFLLCLCALLGSLIAPHDPAEQRLEWRFAPTVWQPGGSPANLLGGDNLGRDILSRSIAAAQVSLQIALITVSLAAIFGVTLGMLAGFSGRLVDRVIAWLIDFQLAFPLLLLALLVAAIGGAGPAALIITFSLALWTGLARVARGETLHLRKLGFIEAAISMSVPPHRILTGHLLPHLLPAVSVVAALDLALVIVAEASLSFIGLGVQPPSPSWGRMIAEGRDFLPDQPWMVIAPGAAVVLAATGFILMGDFLRDCVDPKLRVTRR